MSDPVKAEQHNSVWSPLYQQRGFRALMSAFAFPGRCQPLPDCGDANGPICVASILCDHEVTLANLDELIQPIDIIRLGCGMAETGQANFIVADGSQPPVFDPNLGSLSDPEQGATIIIRVASLESGSGFPLILRGPGINGQQSLAVRGLNKDWLTARARWNRNFPMGVDMILVDDTQVAALPRTTHISEGVN